MIKANDVISLHYSVYTHDGVQLDSSRESEPLLVLLGSRFLIEGLEEALIGKSEGDTFTVKVEAEKAYGLRHENLVQSVPKTMFEGIDVEVGMSFRATTDDGEQSVIVIEVEDDQVVVDGNHPLSGMDLTFDVEILSVRAPTAEELEHGHPHGEKGDHSCG
ncbi:peptidylprolyl isomerase [Alteromonas sediminis]|uniref:Peptidyl-prolyl cis-trans isomerase n=1 Tax=Alteromonas sediminis TaxID=2259342 RepID=A0A3N5XXQ5_9ALTE|nr:peptidylprolyl isomerase [Alteromonas sediminis]RPJ65612.1 peptidylprolyl isomerase [Alteromonas sediminis]